MLGHDPYDPSTWDATVAALGVPNVSPIYVYPPWTLVALLPLGLLPFDVARVGWTIGGAFFGVAALALLLRLRAPFPDWVPVAGGLALTLSGAAVTTVFTAQWGFLLLGALAVAVVGAYRDARWGAIGMFVLLLKPHLFVIAVPGLLLFALVRGSRRFAVASLVGSVVLVGGSIALFSRGFVVWLHIVPSFIATSDLIDATVNGLVGEPTILSATTVGAIGLLAGFGLSLLAMRLSTDWLPVWLSASIAFAPHGRSYDQLPLLVPLILGARPGILPLLTFVVFAVGSLVLYGIAILRQQDSWSVAMPFVCLALLAAIALKRPRPRSPAPTP